MTYYRMRFSMPIMMRQRGKQQFRDTSVYRCSSLRRLLLDSLQRQSARVDARTRSHSLRSIISFSVSVHQRNANAARRCYASAGFLSFSNFLCLFCSLLERRKRASVKRTFEKKCLAGSRLQQL
jgi:hypothetical protein